MAGRGRQCEERGEPVTAAAVADVVEKYRAQAEPYREQEQEPDEEPGKVIQDEEGYEPVYCRSCRTVLIDRKAMVVCEFASGCEPGSDYCRKCFEQGKVGRHLGTAQAGVARSSYQIGEYVGDEPEPSTVEVQTAPDFVVLWSQFWQQIESMTTRAVEEGLALLFLKTQYDGDSATLDFVQGQNCNRCIICWQPKASNSFRRRNGKSQRHHL